MRFEKLINDGMRRGEFPNRSKKAREWFRGAAKGFSGEIGTPDESRLISASEIVPGKIIMYAYDAKHKDKLPYFDAFPVVLPLDPMEGGFLGLNFHYLDYRLRAKLLDELYKYKSNNKFDKSTEIKASYQLLKAASKTKIFAPCLKRYLFTQLRSQAIEIKPMEWDIATFLPIAKFNVSEQRVWKDSRKKVGR